MVGIATITDPFKNTKKPQGFKFGGSFTSMETYVIK